MKRSNFIIAILLIISIIILGVSVLDKKKTSIKEEIDYANNIKFADDKQLLAIAYINDFEEVSSKYISNLENIKVFQVNGNEKYLVIPRYDNIEINIYEIKNSEIENKIANTNLPFIINCNENESISNIIIEVKYNDIVFEFSPNIELKEKDNKISKITGLNEEEIMRIK